MRVLNILLCFDYNISTKYINKQYYINLKYSKARILIV